MKIAITIVLGLCLVGAGGGWYYYQHIGPNVTFRTEELTRGDMVPTISATGTLEPLEVVDVGAQVAGQILSFGVDSNGKRVDFRSPVEKGMILARIDDHLYKADKATADAQMSLAKAGVTRANADLKQMRATYDQAKSDWERAEKLGPSDALSLTDYNKYKASFTIAQANLDVGQAAIDQAEAAVVQAQAAVDRAEDNLTYCTIRSPVDGVIIDRRVNIGQTLVSSLNAPSLFLIARDLRQMQIWVSVNEADINYVYTGQPVTFTVDMLPGEVFHGTVGTMRLNAVMSQNVVTYPVEVNTDNSELKLLPYLTANVEFEVARRHNMLLAPNAALRWYPDPEMATPDVRQVMADKHRPTEKDDTDVPAPKRSSTRPIGTRPSPKDPPHGHGTVWVTDGKFVRPIRVRTGASDGVDTEVFVKNEALKEGMQLVVGIQREEDVDSNANNPFAPQPVYGKKH